MTMLQDGVFDEVKLDRSFVDAALDDPRAAAIARSISSLGRTLGLHVVGEGVESEATAQLLGRYGFDCLQGYHLGRPVPVDVFSEQLATSYAVVAAPDRPVPADEGQHVVGKVGPAPDSIARADALCGHTIVEDLLLEVHDASRDARFAENPFVVGPHQARFYAGTAFRDASGHRVGTVCVLDDRPRSLTPEQRASLAQLGDLLTRHLAASPVRA